MERAVPNWGNRSQAQMPPIPPMYPMQQANLRYATRYARSNANIAARKQRNRAKQAEMNAYAAAQRAQEMLSKKPPPPKRPEGWVRPEGPPPSRQRNKRKSRKLYYRRSNTRRSRK